MKAMLGHSGKLLFLGLFGPLILSGCSRPDTVEVSGTVSWQGAPIPQGEVSFHAEDPHITVAAGKITNGTYTFRTKPGKKRVEIFAARETNRRSAQGSKISELYIPSRYNSESELKIDVKFDADNRFDFALQP